DGRRRGRRHQGPPARALTLWAAETGHARSQSAPTGSETSGLRYPTREYQTDRPVAHHPPHRRHQPSHAPPATPAGGATLPLDKRPAILAFDDEAVAVRVGGRVGPVCAARLAEDAPYVIRGGVLADEQALAYLAVAASLRDQAEHLDLTRRQVVR